MWSLFYPQQKTALNQNGICTLYYITKSVDTVPVYLNLETNTWESELTKASFTFFLNLFPEEYRTGAFYKKFYAKELVDSELKFPLKNYFQFADIQDFTTIGEQE